MAATAGCPCGPLGACGLYHFNSMRGRFTQHEGLGSVTFDSLGVETDPGAREGRAAESPAGENAGFTG